MSDSYPSTFKPASAVPAACLLVALTVLAYLPAMEAGFVFDDGMYLLEDHRMGSVEGLADIWTEVGGPEYTHQYYPLTSSAFWVQHRLWGEDPFGYHFVNVLLHALNALLLWRLLLRLGVPGAWIAGAVFAVHPVHVQSVAWVSELKNVLSTAFFLSAALVFVRWFGLLPGTEARRHEGTEWKRKELSQGVSDQSSPAAPRPIVPLRASVPSCLHASLGYTFGLLLFIGALLSKTATCLLPVGLLLVLWWKRDRLRSRDLLALLPLVAVGVAFVGMTVYLESNYSGAQGSAYDQTLVERGLIAGRSAWFYAGKLLWPATLTFIYPRWEIDAGSWLQYLYPLAALAMLAVMLGLRRKIGKGPPAAVAYFLLAVAPLSFVSVAFTRYAYVADHWQYWASMGLISLGAAGLALVMRAGAPVLRGSATVATALIIAVLAGRSWQQSATYRSPRTLWTDTLAKNPSAWVAHNNLGTSLLPGDLDEAVAHFREALRLNPDFAEAHCNLGAAFHAQGRFAQAIGSYNEALRLAPSYAKAHYNMGNALQAQGRFSEAMTFYRQALRIDPRYHKAQNNLGTALMAQGRVDQAIQEYRKALDIRPEYAEAYYNLGIALTARNLPREAIDAYRQALRINPRYVEARINLGTALMEAEAFGEAVDEFRRAVDVEPGHAGAHYNLGIALTAVDRVAEAVAEYMAAIHIDPEYAQAHNNLAALLQSYGYPDDAVEHYLQAIRIDPTHAVAHYNLGVVLEHQGRLPESAERYRQALQLQPGLAKAHCRLGAVLTALGQPDDAARHLGEAIRLEPAWPAAQQELSWLLRLHPGSVWALEQEPSVVESVMGESDGS